jgi:hypothetical protein
VQKKQVERQSLESHYRLSLAQSIQSIEYHPAFCEIVAVATQQIINVYDLRMCFE